jgi:four helix bundle protein
MGNIRSFRELIVWQKSMDATMRIFELTRRFPNAEMFILTSQILRSSRSVPTNIAEAWRKRRYPAAWVSKLNDCEGEAAETQTHLDLALRCQYITQAEFQELDSLYEEILSMLVNMIDNPDQWKLR